MAEVHGRAGALCETEAIQDDGSVDARGRVGVARQIRGSVTLTGAW